MKRQDCQNFFLFASDLRKRRPKREPADSSSTDFSIVELLCSASPDKGDGPQEHQEAKDIPEMVRYTEDQLVRVRSTQGSKQFGDLP